MGLPVLLTHRTQLVPRPQHQTRTGERQLDLVLDDERIHGMTATERHAVLTALARLLLEAVGIATQEAGDDNA